MNRVPVAERWLGRLSQAAALLAGAGLIAMTAIICLQVFARYLLNDSPPWTEALALLLMLYFVLLAAAIGVREAFHLRVRLLVDRVPVSLRGPLLAGIDVVTGLFGAFMVVNGLRLAELTGGHTIPTLGVSRAAAYWPFVIGGALIIIFSIERVVRGQSANNRGPTSNS